MRKDEHVSIGERFVAADVIWVDMRIDQEPNVTGVDHICSLHPPHAAEIERNHRLS